MPILRVKNRYLEYVSKNKSLTWNEWQNQDPNPVPSTWLQVHVIKKDKYH